MTQTTSEFLDTDDGGGSSIGDLDGTKPVTNRDSKMVMLRGERRDPIRIDEIVESFQNGISVPNELKIVRRTGTYYGIELLLESPASDTNSKYLLTAPGPDTQLYLWHSETDSEGYRIGWSKLAEIKASFPENLPKYPICNVCGEPIKSLEHERLAALDKCDSLTG